MSYDVEEFMQMKCAVITGANRGIGLALTQEYLKNNYRVIAVCRSASEALNASDAEVISGIDMNDAESIVLLAERLKNINIDVLINNAGMLDVDTLGTIDFKALLKQIEVNSLGPLRVTEALLDNLSHGAKVGLITSRMGSISDNGSGGYYGYRMSKAALNAAGMSLAIDLSPKGVAVAILHPGFVQTDMVNMSGDVSATAAAQSLVERMNELTLETSGTFWHANGEQLPW